MRSVITHLIKCISLVCLCWSFIPSVAGAQKTGPQLKHQPQLDIQTSDQSIKADLKAQLAKMLRQQRKTNPRYQYVDTMASIIRVDRSLLILKLKSMGYYAAQITNNNPGRSENIIYTITTAQPYLIDQVTLKGSDQVNVPLGSLQSQAGDRLHASDILKDVEQIKTYIQTHYCLYEVKVDYEVILDHQSSTGSVSYLVQDSPPARFGSIIVQGARRLDSDFIRDRVPLTTGDCFKRSRVTRARTTLLQTGLFNHVRFDVRPVKNGYADILVEVFERSHRTRKIGLGFESEQGLGLNFGWTHRSLGSRAQKFTAESEFQSAQQEVKLTLTLPYFPEDSKTLSFYSNVLLEQTDAFNTKTGLLGAASSNQLNKTLSTSVGLELSNTHLDNVAEPRTLTLMSAPLSLELNRRDDLLNPESGWALNTSFRPYFGVGSDEQFIKHATTLFYYQSFQARSLTPILAFKTKFGTLIGESLQNVPENDRFYSGGGGSTRGYGYQEAGDLIDGKPTGGLSIFEISTEARIRWSQSWGAVVFIDGGSSFLSKTPKIDQSLFWGIGTGLRYYTQFFPVRFDIAFPLERRAAIDSPYALYISIGQAF